jgi:hypothetical protein
MLKASEGALSKFPPDVKRYQAASCGFNSITSLILALLLFGRAWTGETASFDSSNYIAELLGETFDFSVMCIDDVEILLACCSCSSLLNRGM